MVTVPGLSHGGGVVAGFGGGGGPGTEGEELELPEVGGPAVEFEGEGPSLRVDLST